MRVPDPVDTPTGRHSSSRCLEPPADGLRRARDWGGPAFAQGRTRAERQCFDRSAGTSDESVQRQSGAPAAPVSRGGGAGCGDQGCLDRLKALLEDRERELTLAMDEIAKAIRAFAAPVAGVASDQVARVWALDGQVQDELRAEHGSRCAA
jgi:hypothetical protein